MISFNQDMSKQNLEKSLRNILQQRQNTKKITESKLVQKLGQLLFNEPKNNLQTFIAYLEDQCFVSVEDISYIIFRLIFDKDAQKIIGIKAHYSWLLLRIYKQMGLMAQGEKQKRIKVRKTFLEFNFKQKKIGQLIQACSQVIRKKVEHSSNIIDEISYDYVNDVQNWFDKQSKEQLYQQLKYAIQKLLKNRSVKNISFKDTLQLEIKQAFLKQILGEEEFKFKMIPNYRFYPLKKLYMKQFGRVPDEIQQCFEKFDSEATYHDLITLKQNLIAFNLIQNSQEWRSHVIMENEKKLKLIFIKDTAKDSLRTLGLYDPHALTETFLSFRRDIAAIKIDIGSFLQESFHLKRPYQLRFAIRKHSIMYKNLNEVCDDILRKDLDNKIKIILAQIIKYSTRENGNINLSLLINLFKISDDNDEIKSEIAFALGYKIRNSKKTLQIKIIEQIKQLINKNVKSQAKQFLDMQMRAQDDISGAFLKKNNGRLKISKKQNINGPSAIVTKTQQKIKSQYKDTESQQRIIQIMNFSNAMKNRKKALKINQNAELLPTIPDKGGDDRSFWSGTYVNVKNLYLRAMNNYLLKADDKDNYLVQKFLGDKWFSSNIADILKGHRLLGDLITNRLIISTFWKISKKQKLHDQAVEKIFVLLGPIKQVQKTILGLSDYNIIARQIALCQALINKQYFSEPLIIKDFAKNLYQKGLVVSWRSFFKYSVQFKVEIINQIINSVIQEMRIEAAQTIYNCAVRDRKILSDNKINQIKRNLNDPTAKFQGLIMKILYLIENEKTTYVALFQSHLINLEKNRSIEEAIFYILNQTRDGNRCKQLFKDDQIQRLIQVIQTNGLTTEQKISCCEIVNNCLAQNQSLCLTNKGLQICCQVQENTDSKELKTAILLSILLTTQNKKQIRTQIVDSLIKSIDMLDDKNFSIIILILERNPSLKRIKYLEKLSDQLKNDQVVVSQREDIRFQSRNKDNLNFPSISSIVSKIFVQQLQKKYYQEEFQQYITEKSLKNLAFALKSNDMQTKILLAKALYKSSQKENIKITDLALIQMRQHLQDLVLDVSTYLTLAFGLSLKKHKDISSIHIQFLSKTYVFDSRKLGEQDFTKKINSNILKVLLNQADRQQFVESVFVIFNHILFLDEANQEIAIKIIKKYISKNKLIPLNTIAALQNTLGFPGVYNLALQTLEKVITNQQKVSEKTLKIFGDKFYFQQDQNLRAKYFQLLSIADKNQDLSDELFEKLQFQRASYAIIHSHEKNEAISFIKNKTSQGKILPIDTLKALSHSIKSKDVLSILSSISKNKQYIPEQILNKLIQQFDPSTLEMQQIEIFVNVAQNSQNISKKLFEKLQKCLDKDLIFIQIINIFSLAKQNDGRQFSSKSLQKITEKLLSIENSINQQRLLPVFISNISKKNVPKEIFKKILFKAIQSQNKNIVGFSIQGFQKYDKFYQLDDQCISILMEKASYVNDEVVKNRILSILNQNNLKNDQLKRLKIARLNIQNADQLLQSIVDFSKQSQLLKQDYEFLNTIIINKPKYQQKIIRFLIKYSHKKNIPDQLLKNILDLATRANNHIKNLCYFLINLIAITGKKFQRNFVQLLISEENRKLTESTLQILRKNQKSLIEESRIFKIYNIDSITNLKDQNHLLKQIYQLTKNNDLNDQEIKKLIVVDQKLQKTIDLQIFPQIFCQILAKRPNFRQDFRIVARIQQEILREKININIINAYKTIVKSKNFLFVEEVIDTFVDLLQNGQYTEQTSVCIIGCISEASKIFGFQQKYLSILQDYLDCQNENIRSLSFRGLKAAHDKGLQSDYFIQWCRNIIYILKQEIRTQVQFDLELCEILASSKYIDICVIAKKPQNQWKRQLLLSDLLERFQISIGQKLILYANWLAFQQKNYLKNIQYQNILKAFIYYQSINKLSFKEFNEIVKYFFSSVSTDIEIKIIQDTSQSCYLHLKKKWIKSWLNKRLNPSQINNTFLQKFAFNISQNFNTELIYEITNSLTQCKQLSLQKVQFLLNFIKVHKVKCLEIQIKTTNIDQLKKFLQIKVLSRQVKQINNIFKFSSLIYGLFQQGWSFEQLIKIINLIKSFSERKYSFKQQNLISFFDILTNYKISHTNYHIVTQILQKNPQNWAKQMNKLSIQAYFHSEGKVKSAKQLIQELYENNILLTKKFFNDGLEDVQTQLNEEFSLLNIIFKIKDNKLKSQFQFFNYQWSSREIADWSIQDIKLWSNLKPIKRFSKIQKPAFIIQAIAIIKRANFLFTGFNMTDSQILSCLVALDARQKGRLLQVATGEGKSTIICVIAIIYALKGKKVDIVTSSPVLAERDAKEKSGLYEIFGLSCTDNNDKSIYISGPKYCYSKDIVYGEAAQFQFDILRDQYSQLGTLMDRKCELVIVDEVDSMLIDDSSKIARLSSSIAGMDQLQPIYFFLWQRIIFLQKKIIQIDGKMCLFNGQIKYQDDKITLEFADKDGNIMKIEDLKFHLQSTQDISNIGQLIDHNDIDVFLKKHLLEYISEVFKNKIINIPKNFQKFVQKQKPKWIENAILAYSYQENVHYVVHQGSIKPVDYNSTGIVQSSTNWSDGLHQFLQIKHGLKMTSETFTTNFLSNMGYFKRYGSNIFGLTGTLGSIKAKQVLSKIYNVDLINIPSLRQKQYLEFQTKIYPNKVIWLAQICSSAICEANKQRGILIICDTIKHAQIIADKLKSEYRAGAIKVYTMNNMNQESEVGKICSGQIIIATNLAGRGTDIKTDEIQKYGGMHVILTFMPSNQRVQEQAFGRTSRQGKRGTGQMILNATKLIQYRTLIPSQIKQQRNIFEANLLESFQSKELKLIEIKDHLFKQFCQFLKKLRKQMQFKFYALQQLQFSALQRFKPYPVIEKNNILSAIEERWSMFLRRIDDGTLQVHRAKDQFKQFLANIYDDFKGKKVINNPYYHINIANDFVYHDYKLKQAMDHFDRAIQLDGDITVAAFVGKAWLLLKNKQKNYKQKAIIQLNKALDILSNEMASLNSMIAILSQIQKDIKSDLLKQLLQKTNILGTYSNSLQNAIAGIRNSLRLIDVKGQKKLQKYYQTQIQRNSEKTIDIKIDKKSIFQVTFNNLTVREDIREIDQAIDTISKTQKYIKQISIRLNEIPVQQLQQLLNPNIEIKQVNKQIAIKQLKDKSSFLHKYLPESISPNSCKINLTIVANQQIFKKENTSISARNAIDIIEKCSEENAYYNLTFLNVNERSKKLKEVLRQCSFDIEFIGLDSKSVDEKIQLINFKQIDLKVKTNNYQKLFLILKQSNQLKKAANIQFFDEQKKILMSLIYSEFQKRTDQKQVKMICLNFEKINLQLAKTIIQNQCPNTTYCITFFEINCQTIGNLGKDGLINVTFNFQKIIDKIYKLIKVIRQENINFSLIFKHLDLYNLFETIQNASLDQQVIEISKIKDLQELFMNDHKPTVELSEFAARGIQYLLEINQKRFVPWRSIIGVGMLASVQMAAGGVLIATGFGANVGMGLITEGAADIFSAIRAYSTRQFSWTDYAKQKAVSLVISAFTIGMQSLKDAGKGMKNVFGAVKQEALEQAGTRVITNGKTIGNVLVSSGKNLKSLAFKQIGVAIGEGSVREGLNWASDSFSSFALESFKPNISSSIQEKVLNKFLEPKLKRLIHKVYTLDKIINLNRLRNQIDKIVAETISPENSFLRKQWESIGGPLCKGILSAQNYIGSSVSMAMRIYGTLNGLHQIVNIIDTIYDQLLKRISQLEAQTLKISQIIQIYCKIELQEALNLENQLKKQLDIDTIIGQNSQNLKPKQIQFKCQQIDEKYKKNISILIKSLRQAPKFIDQSYLSEIMKSVSDAVTDQIIRITESQLISPWSSYGMGILTAKISNCIQDKLIRNSKLGKQIMQQKEKELKQELAKQKPDQNKLAALNYELKSQQTYTALINHESKRYTIAYSQCQNIHYAQQNNEKIKNSIVSKEVKDHAQAVKSTNKPADLADMYSLAEHLKIDIKIVDDPNYQLTQQDKANGTKIIVFTKSQTKDGVGHYCLLNEKDISQGNNDCGYAVFKQLTGKSIEQLRNENSQRILNNHQNFAQAKEAQIWIRNHYPEEANNLLFQGGAQNPNKKQKLSQHYLKSQKQTQKALKKKIRGTGQPQEQDTEMSLKNMMVVIKDKQLIQQLANETNVQEIILIDKYHLKIKTNVGEKIYQLKQSTTVFNEYVTNHQHGQMRGQAIVDLVSTILETHTFEQIQQLQMTSFATTQDKKSHRGYKFVQGKTLILRPNDNTSQEKVNPYYNQFGNNKISLTSFTPTVNSQSLRSANNSQRASDLNHAKHVDADHILPITIQGCKPQFEKQINKNSCLTNIQPSFQNKNIGKQIDKFNSIVVDHLISGKFSNERPFRQQINQMAIKHFQRYNKSGQKHFQETINGYLKGINQQLVQRQRKGGFNRMHG